MTDKILYEFKMPMNGYGEILYRVVVTDHGNILQIIWGEYTIPIPLIGYMPNYFFELGGIIASKFATITDLKLNLPSLEQSPQRDRQYKDTHSRVKTHPSPSASTSTRPVTYHRKQQNTLDEITIDEAVDILQGKKTKPDKYVKVAITEETMVDFIIKYKGGSELYINGEYTEFKNAKLFIDFDLFRTTTLQLFTEQKILKKTKISKKRNQKYDVFLIPKTLLDKLETPVDESNQPSQYQVLTAPVSSSVSEIKPAITNYLESLFYSFQDSELNLEIFLSEAHYQKIPLDVARDFYKRKLEERDKKLRQIQRKPSNNDPSSYYYLRD